MSVSLVIATFNHARVLAEAIDSALSQTLDPVEVVVVDDGSTDDTPTVLARYAARIRVLRQPNRGLAAARNAGLAATRGSYVAFLDADDVLAPTKLAEQVAVLERAPTVGWTYCDVLIETVATGARVTASERFGYGVRALDGWLFAELIHGNFIPAIAPLVRRTALDVVGGFDERLTALEGLGSVGRRIIADTHNWLGKEAYAGGDWGEARRRFTASVLTVPWQREAPMLLGLSLVRGGARAWTSANGPRKTGSP